MVKAGRVSIFEGLDESSNGVKYSEILVGWYFEKTRENMRGNIGDRYMATRLPSLLRSPSVDVRILFYETSCTSQYERLESFIILITRQKSSFRQTKAVELKQQ
jgi:hypothetical protein